jgi:hypothetical protein
MKKFHHLYIELYGFDVYFIRCCRTLYEKKIKEEFGYPARSVPPWNAATYEVYERENGRQVGVIWLCETGGRDLLVHEVFHVAHFVLDQKGLSLTNDSEEAYAYLIQWMFEKIEAVLFRGRK